jgi:hypothetical protein
MASVLTVHGSQQKIKLLVIIALNTQILKAYIASWGGGSTCTFVLQKSVPQIYL